MPTTFIEKRLNLAIVTDSPGYLYGTLGGPQFNTTITPLASGWEGRRINWSNSRGRWQLGDRLYSRAEWEYLRDFFWARRGALVGFRFRDWSDYQAVTEAFGTGDGNNRIFQLAKSYQTPIASISRTIRKPVRSTVRIYQNGIEITQGFGVDPTSGLVFFTVPPTSGVQLSASFEFDVPVRFERDNLESRFDAFRPDDGEALFYVSSLPLTEIQDQGTCSYRCPRGTKALYLDNYPLQDGQTYTLAVDPTQQGSLGSLTVYQWSQRPNYSMAGRQVLASLPPQGGSFTLTPSPGFRWLSIFVDQGGYRKGCCMLFDPQSRIIFLLGPTS